MTAESVVTLARSVQALVALPMFFGVFGEPNYRLCGSLMLVTFGCLSMAHERIVSRAKK